MDEPAPRQPFSEELGRLTQPARDRVSAFFDRENPQYLPRVAVVGLGLLAVVGLGVYLFLQSSDEMTRQEGWTAWVKMQSRIEAKDKSAARGFDELSKNSAALPQLAQWARLKRAEAELIDGIRAAFDLGNSATKEQGRVSDVGEVTKARKNFNELLRQPNLDSRIRDRALYGKAVCAEVMWDGSEKSREEVIGAYEDLVDKGGPFSELAIERIAALGRNGAAGFYEWFTRVKPLPVEMPPPTTGATSPGETGLPDISDILKKAAGADAGTDSGTPKRAIPRTDGDDKTKNSPDQPKKSLPATKKPDSKKPDSKKSVPEPPPPTGKKKPAEKKPAEKKPAEKKPAAKKTESM